MPPVLCRANKKHSEKSLCFAGRCPLSTTGSSREYGYCIATGERCAGDYTTGPRGHKAAPLDSDDSVT